MSRYQNRAKVQLRQHILTYFPWGGEREEGREEFDLLSSRASNSL